MTKYYNTDKFRKLNNKWYEKLKKSGFVDQEEKPEPKLNAEGEITQEEPMLKTWTFSLFRGRYNATQYEARVIYYRMAGQFLYSHAFDSKAQKTVWEHHCNGLSHRKIDSIMGNKIGKSRRIIVKLSALMKETIQSD